MKSNDLKSVLTDGPQSDSVSHVQILDFVYVFRFFST